MNLSRRYLGDVFTIVVLTLATGAFQSLIIDTSTSKAVTEGNSLLQVVWASVYVVVAIRAAQQYHAIVEVVRANKLLIAFVLLTVFSTLWSADPGLTLRRGVALLGTTLFGIDFAVRYSIRDQLRLLAITLGGVVVLSVVMQVFFPGAIPTVDEIYPDAWVGAFSQKNEFGRVVVLTTMVLLTAVSRSVSGVMTAIAAIVAALALIIAAQSMTSFVALVGLMLILQYAPILRWSKGIRTVLQVLGGVIALPTLYLLVHNRTAVTEMLGRNSSLSGRVKIWALSVSSIGIKPIFGYGYNAFWNVSTEAMRINAALKWRVPHAHNAYLELALELGLVGLALYVAAYVVALRRAAAYMRTHRGHSAKWPLIYLGFVLLYSFTESAVCTPNSIFWMLFAAAAISVTQPTGVVALAGAEEGEPGADPSPSFATS